MEHQSRLIGSRRSSLRKALASLVALTFVLTTPGFARAATPSLDKVASAERLRGTPEVIVSRNASSDSDVSAAASAPIVGSKRSKYLWKFSDTLTYGFRRSDGTFAQVGQVQVFASINLNGGRSDWAMTSGVFSGPRIRATHSFECRTSSGTTCTSGPTTVANISYTTSTLSTPSNDKHNKSRTYWYGFRYTWLAEGHGSVRWDTGTVESIRFKCDFGLTAPCYFP